VADQMPSCLQILNGGVLPFPLLDAVFAEMAQAGFEGGMNGFGRVSLADSDQRDVFSAAACSARSRGDAVTDVGEILCDGVWVQGGVVLGPSAAKAGDQAQLMSYLKVQPANRQNDGSNLWHRSMCSVAAVEVYH
jgi:hypothetical protein